MWWFHSQGQLNSSVMPQQLQINISIKIYVQLTRYFCDSMCCFLSHIHYNLSISIIFEPNLAFFFYPSYYNSHTWDCECVFVKLSSLLIVWVEQHRESIIFVFPNWRFPPLLPCLCWKQIPCWKTVGVWGKIYIFTLQHRHLSWHLSWHSVDPR